MFEVAWCVTLYSTVLFLEFLPMVFEKFGWHRPLSWIHRISVPLMILGVLLSTLHQSSLGTLFLIVPSKLYALWYTPILPLLFWVSAIAVAVSQSMKKPATRSAAQDRFATEDGIIPLSQAIGKEPAAGKFDHRGATDFLVEGLPEPRPGEEFLGRYRVCTPNYFKTMGIAVLKGRAFTDQDKAGAQPVIIVNETLARKYWPNVEPIGKRMRYPGPLEQNPWMEVVGVVKDVKHDMTLPITEDFYTPHAQDGWQSMVLVAKTKVEPAAMAAPIRQQVWSIDKDLPVFEVRTMHEVRAISLALYSFSSVMLSIFAGIALVLAAIGIYGVMSYAVTQRTQEIGIRMALGADPVTVLRMIVGEGLALASCGLFVRIRRT
jgi:hypothetical protein